MENGASRGSGNPNYPSTGMIQLWVVLLLLGLLQGFHAEVLGQGGPSSSGVAGSYRATVHQIKEPGVGIPNETEIFMAVKTDGFLHAAKEKAMEDVRFQARQKGLSYEILGISEERLGFGYRVKIQYRLKRLVVEVPTPETIWWQELLIKIQGYLPYLKKVLAEAERFVNSSLAQNQNTETPGENEKTP